MRLFHFEARLIDGKRADRLVLEHLALVVVDCLVSLEYGYRAIELRRDPAAVEFDDHISLSESDRLRVRASA